MDATSPAHPVATEPASEGQLQRTAGQLRAAARLKELRRAFQKQLNRKGTSMELAALERAAVMTLRAEAAAFDIKSTSADVVRLDNAARRARLDFERIIAATKPKPKPTTLADIEREVRAHG